MSLTANRVSIGIAPVQFVMSLAVTVIAGSQEITGGSLSSIQLRTSVAVPV